MKTQVYNELIDQNSIVKLDPSNRKMKKKTNKQNINKGLYQKCQIMYKLCFHGSQ